jgi:hypothetical protein
MSSPNHIDISDDESDLIDAVSGITPTLPGDESPIIKALIKALDDAAFELAYAQIPREHKINVKGIKYVNYAPYRSAKYIRKAWY